MQSINLVNKHTVEKTARVMQIQGMMDYVSPETEHKININNVDIDFDWSIGLIVGASGSGKSTIANNIFKDSVFEPEWGTKPLVDEFPKNIAIKDITGALTKVGLGSVPAWLRPYHTLSNGEKFRADMARALLSDNEVVTIDEFTSVVDRTVAQVASNSIQKSFRKQEKKLIAVSCHYDIMDWLQPDWVIDLQDSTFRRRLRQSRPSFNIEIRKGTKKDWESLKHHHYMSGNLHAAARIVCAYHEDRLVGFASYLHFPHPKAKNIKMGHRTVVIPDYQGLGLGLMMDNYIGAFLKEEGFRYRNVTTHPAMIRAYQQSDKWALTRVGTQTRNVGKSGIHKSAKALAKRRELSSRATAAFEYKG